MKKIFALAVSAFCLLSANVFAYSVIIWPGGQPPKPPQKPLPPIPSSVGGSSVDCDFDEQTGELEFLFNEDLGTVRIVVTNAMGVVVGSYVVDSSVEPMAIIRVTAAEGEQCTIAVQGESFSGTGSFVR